MSGLKNQPSDMIVKPCCGCEIYNLDAPVIIGTSVDPVIPRNANKTFVGDPKLDQLLHFTGPPENEVPKVPGPGGLANGLHTFTFGRDIEFGTKSEAPEGSKDVGEPSWYSTETREDLLLEHTYGLLDIFATEDSSGIAKRIFDTAFRTKSSKLRYYEDKALNEAAKNHPHIKKLMTATMRDGEQNRIHNALKCASWDINNIVPVTDMGLVPAFDDTVKLTPLSLFNTGDGSNGLSVSVNSIQHVIMVATGYSYNQCTKRYCLDVTYILYDVFGIDDHDVVEYGADGGGWDWDASKGIMAWWQLQHQHGYAPLITRMEFTASYDTEAT